MKIFIQQKALVTSIIASSYSMSKKTERSNLNSMFFNFTAETAKVVTTCGNTMTMSTINNENNYYNLGDDSDIKFLLQRTDVSGLISFLKNNFNSKENSVLQIVKIEINKKSIIFELNGNINTYNLMDADEFPNYTRVIPHHNYCEATNNVMLDSEYLGRVSKIFKDCKPIEFLLNKEARSPVSIKSSHIVLDIDILYVIMPVRL